MKRKRKRKVKPPVQPIVDSTPTATPVSIEPLEKMALDLKVITELAKARTPESIQAAIEFLNFRRFGGDDTISFNRVQFLLSELKNEIRSKPLK